MTNHILLGRKGEQIAVRELENMGYEILEKNWRFHKLEIDIIARLEDILVFIEVKTRVSGSYGYPEYAIDDAKIERMYEAAGAYIDEVEWDKDVRYDVISIILKRNEQRIYHIKDAFIPY